MPMMNYTVHRNLELKLNEEEGCLGTAQILISKRSEKSLSAAEVCFSEAKEKIKELRPLLATLRRVGEANNKQIQQLRKTPQKREMGCQTMKVPKKLYLSPEAAMAMEEPFELATEDLCIDEALQGTDEKAAEETRGLDDTLQHQDV